MSSETSTVEDPLSGWDPRRRAALERLQYRFKQAGGDRVSLSDDLVAERRSEAAAEDGEPSGVLKQQPRTASRAASDRP